MTTVVFPWKRYALIAELAQRVHPVNPKFGKTALQKLIYFLQEVYDVDCGYEFQLYSYGPFDQRILGDLNLVDRWGCVSVTRANDEYNGYIINPGKNLEILSGKADDFMHNPKTVSALQQLVETYGEMSARNLELRATTVFVVKNLQSGGQPSERDEVIEQVAEIKPRFSPAEIKSALEELIRRKHVEIAA